MQDNTASFFSELADVLDRLSTFNHPLLLTGDVNIRLERTSDPHAVEFADLLAASGLVQRVQCVTHDAGGTLDVVCTRDDWWWFGVVVSSLASINEVNQRRARLVLRYG